MTDPMDNPPWRWLEPHEAFACLREHGVWTDPPPRHEDSSTVAAERRVHTIGTAFLRFAWQHVLPGTRYVTQPLPTETNVWWMTVLVQENPGVRRAIACAVPWDQAEVLHPAGQASFRLSAFPKVLMARTGLEFAEAPVHPALNNDFVDVERAIANGMLEAAWCAREETQLRETLATADVGSITALAPESRRRL